MSQTLKTIAIVLITAIVALFSLKVRAASPKSPQPQNFAPGCIASVPKSWGTFRGASTQSGLAFEDASGTIRFLTNIPCQGVPSVSLQINRTDKQQ